MKFFDEYDRFYRTSETSPFPHRLNSRYEAIVSQNKEKLKGAKVLDIASHDGRWSFAAIKAGAEFVKGIEARSELVANANKNFQYYDIPDSKFEFVCGDVFELLIQEKFDVVFCLGFFYHTLRHAELLDRIERTGAKLVVVDTEVIPGASHHSHEFPENSRLVFDNPYSIQLLRDKVSEQEMAFSDSLTRNGHTLVGRPSEDAIQYMSRHFGFSFSSYDWPSHFEKHPDSANYMVDYCEEWRGTYKLSRV